MDETTLSLHPILRKCWMKRGHQRRIPAPGQQKHHHIFGAYNWRTDQTIWVEADRKNTNVFIRFLEHFMASLDTQRPVVLVLDNASYHHSAEAEAALALCEQLGILVCWLPPYCSDLNPIERFWGFLKDRTCANKLFASVSDLLTSVTACLLNQNDMLSTDRLLFLKT